MLAALVVSAATAAPARQDVQGLFDRYIAAVHALDAKALRGLCDAESAAIGELVVGPEDIQKIRAYEAINHLPEAILQARRNTSQVREGLKGGSREELLEQAIRKRLSLAGDEWCKTAEGRLVQVEELAAVRDIPPGTVVMKVQWAGVDGVTTLMARPTPAGWRLSYYAMCVYVASLFQEMTWVRGEKDADVEGDPRGDPAAILASSKGRTPTQDMAKARSSYLQYCAECHGDGGRGDSADAWYFDPRPRDFQRGIYKFRSTPTGQLPLDEDLFRAISRGLPGTGMPAWGEPPNVLPDEEIWGLVDYLKTLSPRFKRPAPKAIEIPEPPKPTPERVASGRAHFEKLCTRCHGTGARGNGPVSEGLFDEWGDAIRPADLTKPWRYKNGISMVDIYRTVSTGVDGTPMPSFADALTPEERWDLAAYLRSLHTKRSKKARTMVRLDDRTPPIPLDPKDAFWDKLKSVDVRLTGQMQVPPRLTFPAVDHVRVKCAIDADAVAFHLTWNDRSVSGTAPTSSAWAPKLESRYGYVSVRQMVERRAVPRLDGIQLQFSPAMDADIELVPEIYGDAEHPVHLWTWHARGEPKDGVVEGVVTEAIAKGTAAAPTPLAVTAQGVRAAARWDDGQWRLVLKRELKATDAARLQFPVKGLIPFALHAWDGNSGEEGLLGACSTWYNVQLLFP